MLILSIVVFLFTVAAGLFALARERARARPARAFSERDMAAPMTLRRTVGDDIAGESSSAFQSNVTLWVRVGITVLAAPFVGFIILSKSADAATKNFAFTTVGTILGFWLSASSR
jgi:hypothetical protein